MVCCRKAPNHYLNQFWLTTKGDLWHSPESNFPRSAYELRRLSFKVIYTSHRGLWVNNDKIYILSELAVGVNQINIILFHSFLVHKRSVKAPKRPRCTCVIIIPLKWRHNESHGVSNHRRLDGLRNRLFRHRSKKTSKLRVTGLCEGNSPHKWPVTRKCFHLMTSSGPWDIWHM